MAPWGFDPAIIKAPLLLLHGGADRFVPPSHTDCLARLCPTAQSWFFPDDGHLSIFEHTESALEWLRLRLGPS